MTRSKGSGKGGEDSRHTFISKALTQILRHKAVDFGLNVRSDGFVHLDEVLLCKTVQKHRATLEDVRKVVAESDKKRFELVTEGSSMFIRAVQGHSMKVVQDEDLMRALSIDDADLPEECVHGTYRRHLPSILQQGLLAGGRLGQAHRNHIHFAPYAPWDGRVVSGMRYDADIVLWVDLREALKSGIPFYMAKNEVILTPGLDGVLDPKFISRVHDLKSGADVSKEGLNSAQFAADTASSSSRGRLARTPTSVSSSCEELSTPLMYYRLTARSRAASSASPPVAEQLLSAEAPACDVSGQDAAVCNEVLRIPSPCGTGASARVNELLTHCCWSASRSSSGPFATAFVYLHGFPDQSLDHRLEHASFGSISSRFPSKLASIVLREQPEALFVTFNFSGTPGSHSSCRFEDKTVSQEVSDARAVLRFLRESGRVTPLAVLHVVGLSTGAIVAALLRGFDERLTITTIAGLVNVDVGLTYDFSPEQLAAFKASGHCMKEFWLPVGSQSNPPAEFVDDGEVGSWKKAAMLLRDAYREDFLALDIRSAVASARSPLLVIHGDVDENVPVDNGKELFEAAAEPKRLMIIPKGNHLLSSSKHFEKAARALISFAQEFT